MEDLITIQKHLSTVREENLLLTEAIKLMKVHFKNHKEVWEKELKAADYAGNKVASLFYRAVAVLIVVTVIAVYLGYNNMRYGADNRQLVKQIEEYQSSDLPQRFDNVLKMLQIQNARVLELETANKALIENCRPCDVKKAIKATKLPKLEEV